MSVKHDMLTNKNKRTDKQNLFKVYKSLEKC